MGDESHFSAAFLTPPLPLPALEPQLQFLEYQAWCYAQWLCFKVFPGSFQDYQSSLAEFLFIFKGTQYNR